MRFTTLLFYILVFSKIGLSQTSLPEDIKRGRKYYLKDDSALVIFNEVLRKYPKNLPAKAIALYHLGNIYTVKVGTQLDFYNVLAENGIEVTDSSLLDPNLDVEGVLIQAKDIFHQLAALELSQKEQSQISLLLEEDNIGKDWYYLYKRNAYGNLGYLYRLSQDYMEAIQYWTSFQNKL